MNQTKRFLNPQAIISLYGKVPQLVGSEVLNLEVKRDEPRLAMKLMTDRKPLSSPARWPKNYDVVYVGLSFIGVRNLSLTNWGHENVIEALIFSDNDESTSVHVSCKNKAEISFVCDWVRIEGVTYGQIGSP
jgi:hypothetical protein